MDDIRVAINKAAQQVQNIRQSPPIEAQAPKPGLLNRNPSQDEHPPLRKPSPQHHTPSARKASVENVENKAPKIEKSPPRQMENPDPEKDDKAFKNYLQEMTTFLDNEAGESDNESSDPEFNFLPQQINIAAEIDREDDILEQDEAMEPFNFDELAIS